jgi:hypothetical protein
MNDDRERTRKVAALAYLIYREWWRPLRNKQRRREIRALIAEDEQ